MKISFNVLNGQSAEEKTAIIAATQRVLDSGYYVLGPEVKKFEASLARYIGTEHAIGVANGLEALQIALLALGIVPGDEVITTPLSAVATALAIKAVGAKIVFVDIDEFNHLDADKIAQKITPKTKAIIPVHLYGQATDLDVIMTVAQRHNLAVIEDCAQAHGTMFRNKKVGSFGTLGCFSFYPTKNLGALGDAGLITTNNPDLAEKCRMLRNYGQKNRYEHAVYGINSRLDELQAAILSERLPYLDNNNARRLEIADLYRKELASLEKIKLPPRREGSSHIYHLFVIEVDERDSLQTFLKEKEIDTLVHYPIPMHHQECLAEYKDISLPIVEGKVNQILSLPIHPYLSDSEVLYVCEMMKKFFQA